MVTQVVFKIDKKLKNQAMARAQLEGIALSSILKFATKAYVSGDLKLGLVGYEKLNATTEKELESILRDFSKGKNLSPRFSSAKEAIKYLKS